MSKSIESEIIPDENKRKKYNKRIIYLISSFEITKLIFTYIPENIKLNILFYNKNFQRKLGIDIEDIKKVSGRYKIVDDDGYGKEYSLITNNILFNGQYINGKKNGYGKEFFENKKLKYTGVYLDNNKFRGHLYDKNGTMMAITKGKTNELYYNGNSKFIGEYYKNKKWNGKGYNALGNDEYEIKCGKGNVKEFNYFGNLIYEGEYINGERNGYGKEYDSYNGNLIYVGEYLNGKKNGYGKEYSYNGSLIFEGEYLNGKKHGYGKEYSYNGSLIYKGDYLNGKKHGYGKEYNSYNVSLIF